VSKEDGVSEEGRVSKVVYWMTVSLDGFIETRGGEIDWTAPDDELSRFFNECAGKVGAFLYGRRTYELMASFWPTADQNLSAPQPIAELACIWRRLPKVVFSKTRRAVEHNSRLAGPDIRAEVLAETRAFPGGVVFLRYDRAD